MTMSAMYKAATGMGALATGMAVVSNNLANVNTVGFKAARTNYEDLIYQCYFSGGNHNQVGKGSQVSTIQTIFNQGAFKNAQQDTDIALAGDGFFNVRTRDGSVMYTRNGEFSVRKDGFLENQSGNILQGWKMSTPKPGQPAQRMGEPVDIQLPTTVPPVATSNITMIGNLNATDKSSFYYPKTEGFEGMGFAGAWDGQKKPPIDKDSYSYAEGNTIYDEAGNPHQVMVYYQKNPHMENVWDYIVTANPEEDARVGADGRPMYDSKSQLAGLLQKGKLTFNADGKLKDMEADNFDVGAGQLATADAPTFAASASNAMQTAIIGGYYNGSDGIDPETGQSISSARSYTVSWGYQDPVTGEWSESNSTMKPPVSGMTWTDNMGNNGFIPVTDKNYAGPYEFGSGMTVTFDNGDGQMMEFGEPGADSMTVTAHSEQATWTPAATNADGQFAFDLTFTRTPLSEMEPPYPDTLETVTQTVGLYMGARKPLGLGDMERDEVSMTQYGSKSNTVKTAQDGYPEGALQRVSVREDGMLMGIFDKGRQEELYQITVTRFRNNTDLSKQGDNLFMPTRKSGEGFDCVAGQDGAGQVLGNFLEQSTVDTATEIVTMIMTQRGFQANSKSITTSDAMLATAIQTKK